MPWGRIILFVIGLILTVVLWLFGDKVYETSFAIKVAVSIVLLSPALILALVGWFRKRKAKAVVSQASKPKLPAEEKAKIEDRLRRVKEVLDASKLAGDVPLHLLPRALVIGATGSGKTSAIFRSHLKFPFKTPAQPTSPDPEFWVSTKGTLIDVPGRLFVDGGEANATWLGMLQLLAKRREPPVDAIVLVVDLSELITASNDDQAAYASRARRRLHEAMRHLGWRVPVNVLFSKTDRIVGFVESFAVLSGTFRAQPFGFALDESAQEAILPGLQGLVRNARNQNNARLPRLDPSLRPGAFAFCEELDTMAPQLDLFLRRLLEPSADGDRVPLRGAYFSSAAQKGKKIDRVEGRVSDAFGIRCGQPFGHPTDDKGSFFLHDFFAKAVLPYAVPEARSAQGKQRFIRKAMLGAGSLFLIASLVAGAALVSFVNNRSLVASTVERINALKKPQDPLSESDLGRLDALRPVAERLEELEQWEANDPPLFYRFGLYQGSTLLPGVRRAFERAMHPLLVERVGVELESMLSDRKGSGNVVKDYDVLKAYLMLTREVKRIKPEWVGSVLVEVWQRRLDSVAAQEPELLTILARMYARQVGRGAARWPTASETLISDARASLRKRGAEYERIMADAKLAAGDPMSLSEIVSGRVPDALRASRGVERLYSLDGWRKVRLSFSKTNGAHAWVLGEFASDREMIAKTKERYFERFIGEWQKFLRGLSIREAHSLPDAQSVLEELTAKPSILESVFLGMMTQMSFPSVTADTAAKGGDALKSKLGRAGGLLNKSPSGSSNAVQKEFKPLFELVSPTPNSAGVKPKAAFGELIKKLGKVRAAITALGAAPTPDTRAVEVAVNEAKTAVDDVFLKLPEELRKLVKPLFVDALRGVTAEAASERYNRTLDAFAQRVCDPYMETLGTRYPFDPRSAEDALLDGVVATFGPTGAVWTFYNTNLQRDLTRVGDSVRVANDSKVGQALLPFYQKAALIQATLFPGNAAALTRTFQFRPQGVNLAPNAGGHATGVTLELGNDRRTYKFGPAVTWSMGWPSAVGRARLKLEGLNEPALEAWGDWALFRLVDQASVSPLAGGWVELRWSFKGGKAIAPIRARTKGTKAPLLEYKRFNLKCRRSGAN